MNRYVAFLRGMNLGRRRIKNPELCAAFEDIGFTNVAAYLASGNVIFDADDADRALVARSIEDGLRDSLGYEVPTFLRTADEVRSIAAHEPFSDVTGERTGKMQVAMFSDDVGQSVRDSVLALSTDADMLELTNRELYWWPKGNFLDPELDLKVVEGILGPVTIRTKGTVERLAKKFL
ncbi:MAG: DUF1697 domain-containing protein [Chloroflexi bacterium]|nr:DUF1697 domain-containing protein [Chloroflexota bacterium]